MKTGIVALVIGFKPSTESPESLASTNEKAENPKFVQPLLIDAFSDDQEVEILQEAWENNELTESDKPIPDPLRQIYEMRDRQVKEDEDFGNYVEDLLNNPFLRKDIQEHALQWLKSKIRIEEYHACEREAMRVIAEYAFQIYRQDPAKRDFFLAGPVAKVRVRVFELKEADRDVLKKAA